MGGFIEIRTIIARCSVRDIFYKAKAYYKLELKAASIRFLRSRSSIPSKLNNFLILKLYSILIGVRIVKLYLIELFRTTISCDNIANY